ncbi:hypothetical protein [Spirosoma sp. KUDC1026]|uniref:hypothetical protein n=1 Tax=Spirosoma sp. KUDC1026 TaxID=2745947 RepID=UPI00159BC0A4|nr:hypothetical protein [Spirosoma sp. KUDC1026]QKZ14190.1 hypothetical protein HU175_16770 [Spirosoma sp. KUDC1026]
MAISKLKPIRVSREMQKNIDDIKRLGNAKDDTDATRYALRVAADAISVTAKMVQQELVNKIR